jgi:hypothetical protein
MVVGAYVGCATVGVFVTWYLCDSFLGIDLSQVRGGLWVRVVLQGGAYVHQMGVLYPRSHMSVEHSGGVWHLVPVQLIPRH